MELHAVNVGYGDAFFFEWNGHSLLLDTGSGLDGEYCEHPERVDIVSFLIEQKVSRIDTLIISHIHEDHVGKLKEVLEHFSVSKLWIPKGFMTFQKDVPRVDIKFSKNSSKYFYKSLQDFGEALVYCKEKGIPIDTLAQGDSIELDGLRIEVLGAKDSILEEFLSLYAQLKECREDSQKEGIRRYQDYSAETILRSIGMKRFKRSFPILLGLKFLTMDKWILFRNILCERCPWNFV